MTVVKNRLTQRNRDFWDHVEAIAAQVRARRGEAVNAWNTRIWVKPICTCKTYPVMAGLAQCPVHHKPSPQSREVSE